MFKFIICENKRRHTTMSRVGVPEAAKRAFLRGDFSKWCGVVFYFVLPLLKHILVIISLRYLHCRNRMCSRRFSTKRRTFSESSGNSTQKSSPVLFLENTSKCFKIVFEGDQSA